jgi:hypothetical protein
LNNKPILAIYNVERFVRDLGGEEEARTAIEKMEAACRRAGWEGLELIGQYCWGTPLELRQAAARIERIGMHASWAYHWPTFTGAFGTARRPTNAQAMDAQGTMWQSLPQPNILTVSMGWDSEPWGFSQSRVQWRLSPDDFKELCQRAKSLLDERPGDGLASRIVLLDNWNEFGEGHYIFPTRQYGFGYLDAVREVFAIDPPPHVDLTPADIGRGPYDFQYRALPSGTDGQRRSVR